MYMCVYIYTYVSVCIHAVGSVLDLLSKARLLQCFLLNLVCDVPRNPSMVERSDRALSQTKLRRPESGMAGMSYGQILGRPGGHGKTFLVAASI